MKKLLLLVGLVVFSLSAKSEENNIFCYKGHGSSAGLLPHNSSNSICSIPVDSKYVINNRWINNKYCKKLKIKNECLCIKRNQIKLFEEGKITSICEKEDLSEINYKNTKSVKHNETSIENSISKIDNKKFCTKTTNINFKNGNSSWEKKIKLNREYNKAEIIKEAENRKLSLVECIYISDSLRLFDIHKVKLKILNLNNNSYEIVDEEIIKNINAKYEEIDKKYKYDLPNGYIAKLNLDKKNVCKKNNSKLYAGSYLRKDGKEILLKACIYKNKISIININLKNFKEIEYDLRNFAPKENKFWKIINNKFEIKDNELIFNFLRYELGPTKFRLKLDGILQEEEILISKFILSGHEEFKTLKDYYNNLAKSLGCNIKKVNLDDCVKRYLSFFLGTGPMTMEEVDEIKKDKLVMGEIVKAIEEMHRANNQSQQEPTEEEKAFAQAQEQGLINSQNFYKMYDPILEKHLNSRGWTQVNPKLEKILNSMGRSQVPVKHQKRFTIRAGNLNYNF